MTPEQVREARVKALQDPFNHSLILENEDLDMDNLVLTTPSTSPLKIPI